MANDSTVDQQQLQSTIDELYQTIKQLVRTSLSAIDVGDAQQLGELSLYTTLLEAAQAGQLGDRAAFIAMLNMVASDVGADPSGTAAQAMADHLAALNPHAQYAQKSSLGTAAAANTGTDAENVPTTAEADGRYARLSGANAFDTMPAVGGDPIVESGSNSDGGWVKHADGTLECRVYKPGGVSNQIWNFPVPYISNPVVIPACTGASANTATAHDTSATSVTLYKFDSDGAPSLPGAFLFASGWYK